MKKAIIIGLNYRGGQNELPDCELDAKRMAAFCNAKGYHVVEHNVMAGATLKGIFEGLRNAPPTELFFYYSGHGTQYPMKGEDDGMEEALCLWNGRMIELFSDNLIKGLIEAVPCPVVAVFDCCFSGGMDRLVLPPGVQRRFAAVIPPPAALFTLPKISRDTGNSTAFMFASQENEFSNSTGDGGAFTNAFFAALKSGIETTGGVIAYAQSNIRYQKAKLVGDDKRKVFEPMPYDMPPFVPTADLREVFKTSLELKQLTEEMIVRIGLLIGADVDMKYTRAKNAENVFKKIHFG